MDNVIKIVGAKENNLKNVSLEIPNNKLTILTGCNGTGKTSLFKIIMGDIKPVNFDFHSTFKKIFFLPQKIKYPEGLTLFEYVTSFYYSNSFKWFISEEEKIKTLEILDLLELTSCKDVLIENLSSGELQKANIAMALISNADLLLLDEPTSNMDLVNQIKVLDILKKLVLNNGISCALILHDLNLAAKYGENFIGINQDKSLIQTDKNQFFNEKILKNIYNINFRVEKDNENYNIQIAD